MRWVVIINGWMRKTSLLDVRPDNFENPKLETKSSWRWRCLYSFGLAGFGSKSVGLKLRLLGFPYFLLMDNTSKDLINLPPKVSDSNGATLNKSYHRNTKLISLSDNSELDFFSTFHYGLFSYPEISAFSTAF